MRILVFAGVFDPVHNGHVEVIEKSLEQYENANAVVVAEKLPQHKHGATPYQHRYEMLRLAFEGNEKVDVVEAPISEHTVKAFFMWLNRKFPKATFTWLVGSDVLEHMETWKDIESLDKFNVDEILCFDRGESSSEHQLAVKWTPVTHLKTSSVYDKLQSTTIRNGSVKLEETVNPKVATYIKARHLYGY